MRHVGTDGDRAGPLHDVALERHQAERERDRQPADQQADLLLAHLMGIDQALAHRQQQRAARSGDEAGLHQARQRLGLAMAEAVVGVGRDQRLADGEERHQRAHEVERGVDQRRQHAHRIGDPPRRQLGGDQDDATAIEATVASRIRRWGSIAIVASGIEGAASSRARLARRGGIPAGRAGGTRRPARTRSAAASGESPTNAAAAAPCR